MEEGGPQPVPVGLLEGYDSVGLRARPKEAARFFKSGLHIALVGAGSLAGVQLAVLCGLHGACSLRHAASLHRAAAVAKGAALGRRARRSACATRRLRGRGPAPCCLIKYSITCCATDVRVSPRCLNQHLGARDGGVGGGGGVVCIAAPKSASEFVLSTVATMVK